MRGPVAILAGAAVLALSACPAPRDPEDPAEWYDPGTAQDVEESIAYTDEPYGLSGIGDFTADIFPVEPYTVAYAPGDGFPDGGDCPSVEEPALPWEIEGIVTLHPRLYMKTVGCGYNDENGDSEEKYYGNFFIEDDSGGAFVLGDSKVAHFDVGNRVKLRVRGARTNFDLDMVYSWDVVEVDHTVRAVHYEPAIGPLDYGDLARVRRVTGTVLTNKDTFGLFTIEADDGTAYAVQLDSEINRRGLAFDIGERIQVTGPVLYSYSVFSVIVMETGQIVALE